jgi:hypothetical protein
LNLNRICEIHTKDCLWPNVNYSVMSQNV